MAKSIGFNITLSVNGKDTIVKCKAEAQNLSRALGQVKTQSDIAHDAVVRWSSVSSAIKNAYDGFSQVANAMSGYIQKANAATEAQTKLTTVMRQRMSASEADVKAVNEAIAAQSKLGVVSGTVQKSGMQQLATFATTRETLTTLLPAMNNLLVQQNGLNASSESAVGIANLIGKALMGNYSALKRVGITFTDAQANMIKYGDEGERAATIAEVITQNVGNMNAEMAKTDAGKAKQAANNIGALQVKLGQFFSQYQGTIMLVGQVGSAVSGIGMLLSGIKALTTATGVATLATKAWSTAQASFSAMGTLVNAVINGTTLSVTQLRIAIRGTILSLGLAGVAYFAVSEAVSFFAEKLGALGGASDQAASSMNKAKESADAIEKSVGQQMGAYEEAIATCKNFRGNKTEEKKVVDKLNNTYGDTLGYFNSVAEWYNALIQDSKAYCNQLIIEAQMRQLANQIGEKEAEKRSLFYNADGTPKNLSDKRETEYVRVKPAYGPSYRVERQKLGSSELEKAMFKSLQLDSSIMDMKGQLDHLAQQLAKNTIPVKGRPAPSGTPTITTSSTHVGGGGHTTTSNGGGNTADKPLKLIATPKKRSDYQNNSDYYQQKIDSLDANSPGYDKQKQHWLDLKKPVDDILKKYQEIDQGFETGSLADYNHQISVIDDNLKNLNLSEERRNELTKTRETLQDKVNSFTAPKGSIADMQNQLQKKQNEFNNATDVEARLKFKTDIKDLQKQIDEATNGKVTIPAEVEEDNVTIDKEKSYQNAQTRAQKIQTNFDAKIIDKKEAEKQLKQLNDMLQGLGLDPIKLDLETPDEKKVKELGDELKNNLGGSVSQTAADFGKLAQYMNAGGSASTGAAAGFALVGQQLQQIGGDGPVAKVGATMAAIGQIVLGFASASAQAGSLGPWAWLAFLGAGLAAVATTISTVQSYATGGIIPGNSYSGDKVVAHVNSGEMILNAREQARLFQIATGALQPVVNYPTRAMIGGPVISTSDFSGSGMMSSGKIVLKVKGRDMVGVLVNDTRIGSKIGKRSNINIG